MKKIGYLWSSLLFFLLLATYFILWYPQHVSDNIFVNDDADYAFAASQGIIANAWDINSLKWGTFLNMGLGKGMEKEHRDTLSNFIRSRNDITFYRHFHGPLFFYGLSSAMDINLSEKWLRISGLMWLFFMAGAVYWSLSIMYPQLAIWIPVLAGGLTGISYTGFSAASLLTGHVAFSLFSIISLASAGNWLIEKNLRWLVFSGIAGGFAFATIEYAPLVPFSILIAACLHRRADSDLSWKSIASYAVAWACIAIFTVLIIWPAGILKLSIVKNYFYHVYLLLMRSEGSYLNNDCFLCTWSYRIAFDPFVYGIIFVGLLFSVGLIFKQVKLYPMLIFALLMIITTLLNTLTTPTYTVSLMGVAICISVVGLGLKAKQHNLKLSLIVIPILLSGIILSFFKDHHPPDGQDISAGKRWKKLIKGTVEQQHKHGPILVHRALVPTLKYYHPKLTFDSFKTKYSELSKVFDGVAKDHYAGVSVQSTDHEKFIAEFESVNYKLKETEVQGVFLLVNSLR